GNVTGSALADRIRAHDARLGIIGQGYVGLPLAMEFADAGFSVVGLEKDLDRANALNLGNSYVADVESSRLRSAIAAGRYLATGDGAALGQCDAIIICVPTPLGKSKP